MAVQICRILGANVVGTAGERNHEMLRELGATPVTYGDGLVDRVRKVSPDGVDAVIDLAGGQALEDSPTLLTDPKRIVSVIEPVRVRELGGHYLFVEPNGTELTQLVDWVEQGDLRVHVGSSYPWTTPPRLTDACRPAASTGSSPSSSKADRRAGDVRRAAHHGELSISRTMSIALARVVSLAWRVSPEG
jgi:NADPH:quinone reductase-like Zn-dependent oxidoreductase